MSGIMYLLDLFSVVGILAFAVFFFLFIFFVTFRNKIDFDWTRKADRFTKVRPSVAAQLLSVEVNSRPRMGALDPALEFYLSLSVSFPVADTEYVCTQSPYENQGISNSREIVIKLKNYILNGANITVFFNPACPNDPAESMAIVENILSWDHYKSLLKGTSEPIPQAHKPIFSGIWLGLSVFVCLCGFLIYIVQ